MHVHIIKTYININIYKSFKLNSQLISTFYLCLNQSGELLFIDLEKCKQETSATRVAEYNGLPDIDQSGWASQTCVLGWSVLGIWPPGADGKVERK